MMLYECLGEMKITYLLTLCCRKLLIC